MATLFDLVPYLPSKGDAYRPPRAIHQRKGSQSEVKRNEIGQKTRDFYSAPEESIACEILPLKMQPMEQF